MLFPQPQFFVLYNGVEPYPDEKEIRLSEAFIELEGLEFTGKDTPALELTVRVININEGRNTAIAARCKNLAEYSAFVAKVRSLEKELGSREEAIKETVKYCQKHGILREFLKAHALEVLSMLFTEFNLEDAIAVAREEGKEDGLEKGQEAAKINIARNLLSEGATFEFVQKITGLDMETIENL